MIQRYAFAPEVSKFVGLVADDNGNICLYTDLLSAKDEETANLLKKIERSNDAWIREREEVEKQIADKKVLLEEKEKQIAALKAIIAGLREEKERVEIAANELHERISSNGVKDLIATNSRQAEEIERLNNRLKNALEYIDELKGNNGEIAKVPSSKRR